MLKKVFLTVLAAILVVGTTNVSAMSKTNEKLCKELSNLSYTVDGEKITVPADVVTEIERYLEEAKIEEEDAELALIWAKKTVKALEEAGAKSFSDLDEDEYWTIYNYAQTAAYYAGVQFDIVDGEVVVTDFDGNVVTTITKDMIRYTDNNTILMAAGVISLLGVAVVTRKIAKANA